MPVPFISTTGPREATRVGAETEVKIPRQTWLMMSLVLMLVDVGLWSIGCLVWARARAKSVGYWRWLNYEWSPWFALEWPWFAVTIILCWIGPSAASYLYRLAIELLARTTPLYDNMSPDDGIWNPLGRRRYEEEPEEEMEKTAETVDLNLWDQPKDGKRRRRRTLPDFLVSTQARSFYRAVANGGAEFSEREARRYGIKRREFRQNIRDALLDRRMADWKDEQHKNLGVSLSPDALRTLELLGRNPLPQRSAQGVRKSAS